MVATCRVSEYDISVIGFAIYFMTGIILTIVAYIYHMSHDERKSDNGVSNQVFHKSACHAVTGES